MNDALEDGEAFLEDRKEIRSQTGRLAAAAQRLQLGEMQLQVFPARVGDPPEPQRVLHRQHLGVGGGVAAGRVRQIPGDAQQRRQIVRRDEDASVSGVDEDAIDEDPAAFESLEELGTGSAGEKVFDGRLGRLRPPFRILRGGRGTG